MSGVFSLDVVVYGATGFVGRLTADLAAHAPDRVSFGLAGRSTRRLEKVRAGLGGDAGDWGSSGPTPTIPTRSRAWPAGRGS